MTRDLACHRLGGCSGWDSYAGGSRFLGREHAKQLFTKTGLEGTSTLPAVVFGGGGSRCIKQEAQVLKQCGYSSSKALTCKSNLVYPDAGSKQIRCKI